MKDALRLTSKQTAKYFIGLDVQVKRGCPFAVLGQAGNTVDSGWLERGDTASIAQALRTVVLKYTDGINTSVALGIDAPRVPVKESRRWYWRHNAWSPCTPKDRGYGRHCEVVIAAHRLANPQWTPDRPPFPAWMTLGFALFHELATDFTVYEVFPSASYRMFADDPTATLDVHLQNLARGPKDMLDAYVAAATVREFVQGRGCEVGGGDGLGTIVLPRPITAGISATLQWPDGASDR